MFEAALQNKVINEPDSFKQGIDYTTAITNSQKDKPDYYLTRGFINILARDFSKESSPYSISEYTNASWDTKA